MPYFLQHFFKNWVKTLVHGTLHKTLLISRRSEKFRWFFNKCHTFCNILLKIGSKPQCTVLCTKRCLFRRDREVSVVFHQISYFFNILLKIGSKQQCTVLCTKCCLFRGDREVSVVFHQMPYFLQHFAKNSEKKP